MKRLLAGLFVVMSLSACAVMPKGDVVAEFWRPISEPNILLTPDRATAKLDFDMSQCRCGIFPANVPQPELVAFQPDQQRYAETSVTSKNGEQPGECMQSPSLVVGECMRARGWEITTCSGRAPVAGGAALCTAFVTEE